MPKIIFILLLVVASLPGRAQKIESIHFNLYTDSLKKGFYNYINVDGKTPDGNWMPLDSNQLKFSSNAGRFRGNDIFIDSSYCKDSVVIRAELRSDPTVYKTVTIYVRKRGFDEPLRSDQEILDSLRNNSRKKK